MKNICLCLCLLALVGCHHDTDETPLAGPITTTEAGADEPTTTETTVPVFKGHESTDLIYTYMLFEHIEVTRILTSIDYSALICVHGPANCPYVELKNASIEAVGNFANNVLIYITTDVAPIHATYKLEIQAIIDEHRELDHQTIRAYWATIDDGRYVGTVDEDIIIAIDHEYDVLENHLLALSIL